MRKVLILLIVLILLLTVSCSCSSENGSNGVESEKPATSEELTSFQLLSDALYFLELQNERIEYLENDLYRRGVHSLKVVSIVSELDKGGLIVLNLITNADEMYYVRITERAFIVDIFSPK